MRGRLWGVLHYFEQHAPVGTAAVTCRVLEGVLQHHGIHPMKVRGSRCREGSGRGGI